MPTKLQFYSIVAERAAKEITAKRGNWTNFLDTAARLYKYPFPDQLLIHAQRPDAVACAPLETWNDSFNRWVRRGAKGIALIDDSSDRPRLKYVFDVNDTEPSLYNSKPVYLWEMRQEHREPVLEYLSGVYDDVDDTLADSFHNIAKQLAHEYYEDNAREIRYRAEDSFLEDFDDFNLGVAFEDALTKSIAYTLMSRCGFDTADHFEDEDFQFIFDFNTPDMVYALGTATGELSQQVLRDIELVIKKYERQHAAERSVTNDCNSDIHTQRGLSSARHQTERTSEGADRFPGTVRENEENIPERSPDDDLQFNAAQRNAVPAPAGHRGSGGREAGTDNESPDRTEQPARQGQRPDGLDGNDEHLESASRGNGLERTDLHLERSDETPSEQVTPADGVSDLYGSLSEVGIRLTEAISASSVKQDEVDSILRDGGNEKDSILRIAAHFAKNLTPEDNAEYLRREYLMGRWGRNPEPGGKGYQFGADQTSVWFDETGLTIGRGKSALYAKDQAHITWELAAERVKALFDAGMYVSHDVLDEALYNESRERADDIKEVYSNMSRGLSDIQYELKKAMPKERQEALKDDWKIRRYLIRGLTELDGTADKALFGENPAPEDEITRLYDETLRLSEEMPEEWNFNGGHDETEERIAELIRDKGTIGENEIRQGIGYSELSEYYLILRRLREDIAALADEPDAPIRFYRNPRRVLSDLEKAGLPAHGFPAVEYTPLNYMRFITDDEVDLYLTGGSHYREGKLRELSYFLHDHTPKERQDFLKNEYGHGGGTWIGGGWHNAEPGKGITLKRPGCEDVNLNWNRAARRLDELIHNGRFMSRSELDRVFNYERIMLARQINSFYYNMPEEYERPLDKDLDFHYPKEAEWKALNELLDDPEKLHALLGEMQRIYVNTPEGDRYFNTRHTAFHDLSSFYEGTYTLFPGLEKLPDPDLSQTRERLSRPVLPPPSGQSEQLTLFDFEQPPILPGVEEQRAIVEQKQEKEAEAKAPAVSLPAAQDGIDTFLLGVTDEDKARLAAQFRENPRSREAVQLVREIYGDDLPVPLPQALKRIAELTTDRKFDVTERRPTLYEDYLKVKAENPDCIVLYQVGDFFEFLGGDAETAARVLDITLTSRTIAGQTERVPMAGVPSHTLPAYTDKLYEAGYGIAISSLDNSGNRSVVAVPPKESEQAAEITADRTSEPEQPETNADWLDHVLIGELLASTLKDRVYKYFTEENPSVPEAAAFLQNEYGIMYTSGVVASVGIRSFESKADGITAHFADDSERSANWTEAANHVRRLIGAGVYRQNLDEFIAGRAAAQAPQPEADPSPQWNEYYMYSPEQRAAFSREYAAWLERNTPPADPFAVYELPNRAGVYAVWDNENRRFYEDENGNISTFTDRAEADTYRDSLYAERDGKAEEQPTAQFDFDTVAQTVLGRVEKDADYLENLTNAQTRAALRNPVAWAVEQSVRDHEQDEPEVWRQYFNNRDFTFRDRLQDFVLRQTWTNRDALLSNAAPQTEPEPVPEPAKELDFDTVARTVYERVMQDTEYSEALANAQNRGALRNPLNAALSITVYEHQENEPQVFHSYHNDDDFGDRLFDFVYRQSWESKQAQIAAETEPPARETVTDEPATEPAAEQTESETPAPAIPISPKNPPPVFFIEWETAQRDFDLRLYNDHDIIGYDPKGVEHMMGRSGNFNYVTQTGAFWGDNSVPGDIYEQIQTYQSGELNDEQVRENYLKVLNDFRDYKAADLNEANGDLIDVLNNGLISRSEKETILILLESKATNREIASMMASAYEREIETMTLETGHAADYSASPNGLFIEILDKFNTKLGFSWADVALVVRALAVQWQAERDAPAAAVETQNQFGQFTEITDPAELAEIEAIFADTKPHTVAKKLYEELSPSGKDTTAYYLFHNPNGTDGSVAMLSHETLSLIKERADIYVICADVCNLSEEERNRLNIGFRKMPRDWNLLPEAVQEQIRAIKPEYEQQWLESTQYQRGFEEWQRTREGAEQQAEPELTVSGHRLYDLVYFDNTLYAIYGITPTDVTLRAEDGTVRVESHERFDALLRTNDVNQQNRSKQERRNFRITDDYLGEGGAKTKFRNNINAINLLHGLEFDKRAATLDEQEILSRYVGWGGIPQAFDPDNKQWENEYLELNAALTPEEYTSARASTLNAHYTSPTVIRALYDAVERMGFKYGNILEPSCGTGNFFGLLPDSMANSKLYGVELDSVTARIAKQLYPKANIKEMGFEKTDTPDAFFDLAVGNVPFGDYGVADKRYDKHKFSIHNYFFAKTLDQVRPGGVIAFLTSKFTMDEKNPTVRKYIAQRAELLGAVRLPNNAFLKNAGTEVTSDIIFLQKRDRPIDIEPDWVHLGLTDDGIPVNRYFVDNPEMILGTMAPDERMNNKFGIDTATTCLPIEGADLAEQLKAALLNVQGQYTVEELDDIEGIDNHAIPADPLVKNFSYALVTPATEPDDADGRIYAAKVGEGEVYFRENSLMYPVDLPATTLERIKGMIALRECVHGLINLQLDEHEEAEITAKQAELSRLYDRFTAEFGLINSQANNRAFNADNAYYLLCSLEILDEDGNLARKADMFTKRTIKQKAVITHVDTASEALAVSLGERAHVDFAYMSELTGMSEDKLKEDLQGVIYLNIGGAETQEKTYVTADEYLSGNIRKKLELAEAAAMTVPSHSINVEALKAAMPKDLEASEIAVRLGATWIDPAYVQQFMYELLNTPRHLKSTYQVKYLQYTGEWQITGKNRAQYSDIHATVTYGTERMNAYQIINDTLNLRDVRVYDYVEDADGKEKRVLNKKETTKAQQRQELIKQAFKDWIWQDPVRRQTLVKLYNERFNSIRPREYDGSHVTFSGISPEITLRQHQLNAIAHILYGGNTLLAHEVGAGKTFEMVGAAMESKRLGLCHKSLFAVPNHLTEQWAGEFLRLYPSANILVATKKDFEMRNRKKFCAKIATGDYDAVIIGHSQLEKIPMSRERQERLLNEQLWEIEEGIAELKESNGERFSIKQLEKTKKSLETRLAKLLDAKRRDDVVTFEQLGVDRLFIDEAHGFKNLFMYTKMRNVAGLSTSEAAKSSDLFMKCRYMDELTGDKGVIFATGTPISNSMTEMYTMQRYLQYDSLTAKNLTHFDCWASIFGETQTSIELAPEGTGYRARTRFAKFHNLPELMCMFKEVADIKTADMLNLPVPDAKYETVVVQPSELQKEMVQDLSERAARVHAQLVDAKVDNMLKITTDGRKIGLDQRLINPLLPDFEGSKVNACTDNVFRIWDETKDGRLTQLVFCDFSTPNKEGRFNIYDDIKAKLLERGIPEHEIAFIHDADTETRKKELFAKVRQGKVRILFGSTFKMGAGTNVQDRLIAIHDADCPWRPADLEQRAGRIVRQGNQNAEVQIFRYVTNATFDAYLYQTLENKQKFISQIMSSKSPVRSCEDVDETALSYAEIKALCAGNPLIAEKMNLDVEVARLRMLKADHQSQHYRLEDDLLKRYPEQITAVTERIAGIEKDIEMYTAQSEKLTTVQQSLTDGAASVSAKFAGMTINGVEYPEKEPAAKALLESCKSVTDKNDKAIGEYMGFKMSLRYDSFNKTFSVLLRGSMTYSTDLGTDAFGNITRINNALGDLPKRLEGAKSQLDTLFSQQEAAKQELERPFAQADELAEKEARLALLNADLNIDGDGGLDVMNDADSREDLGDDDDQDFDDEPDDIDDEDEPRSSINLVNPGVTFSYPNEPVRESIPAKSAKPSLLDGIRAYNAERHQAAAGKKPTERDI
jgi:N12 class adenine-specific DNA methylase